MKKRRPQTREWLVGSNVHVDAWGPYAERSYGACSNESSSIGQCKEFKKLQTTCESKYGMEFDSSIKHTPEQNGVAERMVRTLTERMRCMLVHFDLPEAMWAEAAMTATHYVNIMPSSVRGMEVPYAVWHRHTPAYEKLRTFGCAVLSYVNKVERRKMQAKEQEAVFVGYSREKRGSVVDSIEPMLDEMHEDSTDGDNCSDGADCWTGGASDAKDGSDYQTSEADDTHIMTGQMGQLRELSGQGGLVYVRKGSPLLILQRLHKSECGLRYLKAIVLARWQNEIVLARWQTKLSLKVIDLARWQNEVSLEVVVLARWQNVMRSVSMDMRRTTCEVTVSKPPTWFGDYVYIAYENTNPDEDVSSLPDGWRKARAELQRAIANELILAWWEDYCCMATGELTEPDTFSDAMESAHSMQWENAADDEFDSLMKNDTRELVPREKHMKVLQNRWIFRVNYLANGEIERYKARLVIKGFMQIYGIDYLEVYSPVVRLETLRVLLTLAAVWDYEVHQMDVTTAFLNGAIDVEVYMEQPEGCKACVAVKVIDGQLVFIPLNVDDLILFAPSMELINKMKKMFEDRFAMKDLGELHYILGWEITRNRAERTMFIGQRKYAETVLKRFNMQNCNGCKTPSTADLKLSKAMCPTENDERQLMRSKPYRAVVGSLMYLMLGTRPDLAYLVRESSQFLENPGLLHWTALKRGLRSLKETVDWGIQLGGLVWSNQELTDHLRAHADADFANRVDDRKSVAGYVTQFCGSIISWSSQTEKTVALHTTEAGYMALSLLVQEVVRLRQMLKELQVLQQQPSQVFVDNESAKKLASNPVFHSRTKHIDVRHHFVRERIDLKEIDVLRVPGVNNVADAFTKPLARPTFEKHRAAMGLLPKARFEAAR
ncbi:unnamed protein product [Phytophthora fragariaefolia]|uniref:Unnamed protein product n=1 Tax=Phytophthora fragariaefolia TaxID=1490495 RepID=A0A9W6WTG9_9STRA|nr:unnamed protein product [Phytophthora fragariaefolia]